MSIRISRPEFLSIALLMCIENGTVLAADQASMETKTLAKLGAAAKTTGQLNRTVLAGDAAEAVEIDATAEAPSIYYWGFVENDKDPVRVAVPSSAAGQKTTLTLQVPDLGFWPTERNLVVASFPIVNGVPTLQTPGVFVSQKVNIRSRGFSLLVAAAAVCLAYLMAVLALGRVGGRYCWSPVYLTSDTCDRGSLSQLQVFAFTLIVLGLLAFVLLRTGVLSDISSDILLLLGISAAGTAGSKTADVMKKRLSYENWSWLRNQGWLIAYEEGCGQTQDTKNAHWSDLLKTNGSFDIYSFQLIVFSVLVAYAIVTCEHDKLGTFKVPQNLLFLLGLSNAVYITGKAVAPNSVAELDKKVGALRDAEKKWTGKALAVIAGDGKDKWREAIETAPDEYMDYITVAREAARMLKAIYGESGTKFKSEPIDDAQLMPEFQPAAGIQSVSPQPAPAATAPVLPTAQTPAAASPAAVQKEQPNSSSVSKAA